MSLFLSIVSMLLGPVVYSAANYVKNLREILDGYIFITIICLVCFHIIPEAYEIGGNLIIPFMLIGLLLPVTMEFFFQRALKKTHVVTLMIAMLGLAIHALIDGISLSPDIVIHSHDHGHDHGVFNNLFENHLALGVILHRLPVGMAIWWSIRLYFSTRVALTVFTIITLFTTIGYMYTALVVDILNSAAIAYFQAFVAGSLLHIMSMGTVYEHKAFSTTSETKRNPEWALRVGCTLGIIAFIAVF
ncbi:MAG: hypothetical protein QNK73_07250 [Emcibacteraceae bacterium]|jgi:hypothetical protein|nr:hypothetical protein [Emcibacteraceae bacterium]MDC1428856.1 hypothetical protein [Emcibacteraceae bacterium]|tara:strand:- start:2563 stop:3300 length:738 start_codon:yes stop_codon:yes gene_type:complete